MHGLLRRARWAPPTPPLSSASPTASHTVPSTARRGVHSRGRRRTLSRGAYSADPARALAPLSTPTCVQQCRSCAPALLLCLRAELGGERPPSLSPAAVHDALLQYARRVEEGGAHPLPRAVHSGTGAGRGAHRDTTPTPVPDHGGGGVRDGGTSALLLAGDTGSATTPDAAVMFLRWACQAADVPPEVVVHRTRDLLSRLSCRPGGDQGEEGRSSAALASALEGCLRVAAPVHVASIVRALQLHPGGDAARDGPSLAVWDPRVPPTLARNCLQRVADTVRGPRGGRSYALPPPVLQALHDCAQSALPRGLAPASTVRTELAIVAMAALRHAPFPQLSALYEHLEAAHATVPAVLNRFLANCGLLVGDVVDGAAARKGHAAARVGGDATAAADVVARAVAALASSGRDVRAVEEGLVHGSSVLCALGRHAEVKALYRQYPELRVTPHVVMLYVVEEDVPAAVAALHRLGESRSDGWARFVPMVLRAITHVCALVGRCGTSQDVQPLYDALIAFRNAGVHTSQLLEFVLGGVCARIRSLCEGSEGAPVEELAPRVALEYVVPLTRTILTFIGDDVNADVLLTLLETALEAGPLAVPLTASVVWTLRQATSLAIRELFERVDSSTHHLPFLYYYALCFARDRGLPDTADHLAAVWRAEAGPVLQRQPGLAPPYKLWQCAGCGRLNSDRYNYCSCSALRNSLLVCGTCGYAQDERRPACLRCGAGVGKASAARAVVRRAWACSACGAANPARQVLLCFRCAKPTGPLVAERTAREAPWATDEADRGRGFDVPAFIGYDRATGRLHHPFAARHSAVWRCAGCQQYRSTLERACPTCPQVDCLPAAVCHRADAQRFCWSCGATEGNAFATACTACGECALHASPPPPRDVADRAPVQERKAVEAVSEPARPEAGEVWVLCCPQCVHTQAAEPHAVADVNAAVSACQRCGAGLVLAEHGLRNSPRVCGGCATELPAADVVGAMCPHCWRLVPLAGGYAEAPRLRQTFVTLARQCTPGALRGPAPGVHSRTATGTLEVHPPRETAVERLAELLLGLRAEWGWVDGTASVAAVPVATLAQVRVEAFMELRLLLSNLDQLQPLSAGARRAAALTKQLMAAMDAACGRGAQPHFASHEVCHECLGGHPVALCSYAPQAASHTSSQGRASSVLSPTAASPVAHDSTAPTAWTCEACGVANTNADVCRYICMSCLELRPEVQALLPSECWECARCRRANVEFETYCIHCGVQRPAVPVSSVTAGVDTQSRSGVGEPWCGTGATETAPDEVASVTAAVVANHIPFLPSRCALCGLVYLEANCPLCTNHLPDVKEARGVVCAVGVRHAYIQPLGTTNAADRVLVDEHLLRRAPPAVGKMVHYHAEFCHTGRHTGYRATRIRD